MPYTMDVKRQGQPWERCPALYPTLSDAMIDGARMIMLWGIDHCRFTEQPDSISQGEAYAQRLTNEFIFEACR